MVWTSALLKQYFTIFIQLLIETWQHVLCLLRNTGDVFVPIDRACLGKLCFCLCLMSDRILWLLVVQGNYCFSSIIAGQEESNHISIKGSSFMIVLNPNGSFLGLPEAVLRNMSDWGLNPNINFKEKKNCWISSQLNFTANNYSLP